MFNTGWTPRPKMTRYRPPAKSGSKYITREGELLLKEELKQLWKNERPKVTQQVSEAAALGDRSENAEYIYGKKRLREIDRRVRYLTKRLEELKVVSQVPSDKTKAYFGCFISVEGNQGEKSKYRLVGPDEINPEKGYISIDSPLGKAVLGKEVGSKINIQSPQGKLSYELTKVEYSNR